MFFRQGYRTRDKEAKMNDYLAIAKGERELLE